MPLIEKRWESQEEQVALPLREVPLQALTEPMEHPIPVQEPGCGARHSLQSCRGGLALALRMIGGKGGAL